MGEAALGRVIPAFDPMFLSGMRATLTRSEGVCSRGCFGSKRVQIPHAGPEPFGAVQRISARDLLCGDAWYRSNDHAPASLETGRERAQRVKARKGFRVSLAEDGAELGNTHRGRRRGNLAADTVSRASVFVG